MIDISNKLHALVDEFVSNLSSECNSLAHSVSAQAQKYIANEVAPDLAQSQRPSNRTAAEVLNGLKRPSGINVADPQHREGKTHMSHAIAKSKAGSTRSRDGGRSLPNVEVISSDNSSDECPPPKPKVSSKKLVGNHCGRKTRISTSRGRSTKIDTRSPSRSPESSHMLDYSYEGDTKSVGANILDVESTLHKLRWPDRMEDVHTPGGEGHKNDKDVVHRNKESSKIAGSSKRDEEPNFSEGDDTNEDEIGNNATGSDSNGEDLPVLPKVPVKRRLLNEARAQERKTQRGKIKSTSPQIKKHKTPVLDPTVITQLVFGRRPANSVSTHALCL